VQCKKDLRDQLKADLVRWYDGERPRSGDEPERYVVCAGLVVLEHMKSAFPLQQDDYLTQGNQVKTSGAMIGRILSRYGETRTYAKEGARTTRRTRVAAEALVEALNAYGCIGDMLPEERSEVIDDLQGWLADRATEYFERKRIEVDVEPEQPMPDIIGDILRAAHERNLAGAIAQYLVGAKLALRYPDTEIENHSYTTADEQLGRPGDFLVGDSVFHVAVTPMPPLFEKCQKNVRDGYRVILLTQRTRLEAAKQMGEQANLQNRLDVSSIEQFVGRNISEMGEFTRWGIQHELRNLLEMYNSRVEAVETNKAIMVEIPTNL
jgi:hypothetical protein